MNLNFKFDQFNPDRKKDQQLNAEHSKWIELYETEGNARYLWFVLKNGDSELKNYAYLTRVKHIREENTLHLFFGSDIVLLKGRNLEKLLIQLNNHKLKTIICTDQRYSAINGEGEAQIYEISFQEI